MAISEIRGDLKARRALAFLFVSKLDIQQILSQMTSIVILASPGTGAL